MSSMTSQLMQRGLIQPPSFLRTNVMYETLMGSTAYGVATDASDQDVTGFCIPPKRDLFPHLAGEIAGFGTPGKRFEQFQDAHIQDPDRADQEWDLSIYSITRYLTLCMECNPNMIDSLFTPQDCVVHMTRVGSMVRDQRRLFLHKGCWQRFKGYAMSTMHKMRTKSPIGNRRKLVEQFGFDVKYAYHVVRLLDECEQILREGDLDLRRSCEHLRAIRQGNVSEQEIQRWAADKEQELERLYHRTRLPETADEERIRRLLLECLEEHYGRLDDCVVDENAAVRKLREIHKLLEQSRDLWDNSPGGSPVSD